MNERVIILLTAAYRFDNLYRIAQNILEIAKDNVDTKLHWVICKDVNRGFGDMSDAIEFLNKNDMLYSVIDSGLPNDLINWNAARPGNFGGDMYNTPLKIVKESFYKDIDPWVYILDDDNLLHPLFIDTLKKMEKVANGRRILWMTKIRSTGIIDEVGFDVANVKIPRGDDGSWFIPMSFSPDPSQMVLKESIIRENGYYNPESDYDYTWFIPLTENHMDEIVWYNEVFPYNCNKSSTYWNGLRSAQQIKEDIEIAMSDNQPYAGTFRFETNNSGIEPHVYTLDKDTIKQLLNIIKFKAQANNVKFE